MMTALTLVMILVFAFGGVSVLFAFASLFDPGKARRPSEAYYQRAWGRRYQWLWVRYGLPAFVVGLAYLLAFNLLGWER